MIDQNKVIDGFLSLLRDLLQPVEEQVWVLVCQKCNSSDILTEWCPKTNKCSNKWAYGRGLHAFHDEVLHHLCRNCGYSWNSTPLDLGPHKSVAEAVDAGVKGVSDFFEKWSKL